MELHFTKGMATPGSTVDLCRSCRYGRLIEGHSQSEVLRVCERGEAGSIPFKVQDCTQYMPKNLPYLHDLEQVAWLLRSDEQKKTVGFVKPEVWLNKGIE